MGADAPPAFLEKPMLDLAMVSQMCLDFKRRVPILENQVAALTERIAVLEGRVPKSDPRPRPAPVNGEADTTPAPTPTIPAAASSKTVTKTPGG